MTRNTPATKPRPARPPVDPDGYLGSSLDLRAGLEVREFAAVIVPGEVRRELMRLSESFVRQETTPSR
jgi:hypothetical protein